MALVDLITPARAKLAFPSLVDNSQDGTIQALIGAASRAIETFCHRVFSVQSYDEVYDQDGTGSVLLRHFPVLSVSRLAVTPQTVLTVQNTSSTLTTSRAVAQTTLAAGVDWESPQTAASTGLTLTRTANGVTTVDGTFLWTNYPTVQNLADAINALSGSGWKATVQSGFGAWPTADVNPIQGAYSCLGSGAQLTIHTTDLNGFDLVPETGEIRFSGTFANMVMGTGWLPGSYSFDLVPGVDLPKGSRALRVQYQAGFQGLPLDVGQPSPIAQVAHACALLTAHFFSNPAAVGNLRSETIGGYSYSRDQVEGIPHNIQQLIAPFRDRRV